MNHTIFEILRELGYTPQDHGKDYRMMPSYRDSGNPTSLSVSKASGRFIDFGGGVSGSFEDLVKLTLGLKSIEDAKKYLQKKDYFYDAAFEKQEPLIKGVKFFNKGILSEMVNDHSYWNGRKISDETLDVFGGGVLPEGRMKGRYTFPIWDKNDKLVGLSGRDVSGKKSIKWKHLGDKAEWKFPCFYNQGHLASGSIILVESIGDMLTLWENNIRNVIVTFGLHVSNAVTTELLKQSPKVIYISFNNDIRPNRSNSGAIAASKMQRKLSRYFDDVRIRLPKIGDCGEMSEEEILSWLYEKI
jgi:hypothetical protein